MLTHAPRPKKQSIHPVQNKQSMHPVRSLPPSAAADLTLSLLSLVAGQLSGVLLLEFETAMRSRLDFLGETVTPNHLITLVLS